MRPIRFLAAPPRIDGQLGETIASLPAESFNYTFKMAPDNPDFWVSYRLAYGTAFLYLYVEVAAKEIVCRDRGYQNGDGILLVLAQAQPDNAPSQRFMYLAFWPRNDPTEPAGTMIWGQDGRYPFRPLERARFAAQAHNGTVGFELLVPWEDIAPYHPWLMDSIGFELFFSKAVGDIGVNIYSVALDELDESDPNSVRYVPATFEPPVLGQGSQTYVQAARHCKAKEALPITSVTAAAEVGRQHIELRLKTREGSDAAKAQVEYDASPGLTQQQTELPTGTAVPGDYELRWQSQRDGCRGSAGVSLLPEFRAESLRYRLARLEGAVSPGSLTTLQYRLGTIAAQYSELDPAKTYPQLHIEAAHFLALIQQAEAGCDALATQTGLVRRAFRSAIDGTLQPYTIYIPEDCDDAEAVPTVVHLHGSDRDDTALTHHHGYAAPADFIQIAPFGRGTLTAYTRDHAQEDIGEAIADACTNYPVDADRLVLAGFSMGGYGVYRTHFETPNTFRGLAIFSGIPNLAETYFPGEGHPGFLDDANLVPFKDVPMFVFHGSEDRNAPVELTTEVVDKLRAVGAQVEFYVQDGAGHSAPDQEATRCYHAWLARIL